MPLLRSTNPAIEAHYGYNARMGPPRQLAIPPELMFRLLEIQEIECFKISMHFREHDCEEEPCEEIRRMIGHVIEYNDFMPKKYQLGADVDNPIRRKII